MPTTKPQILLLQLGDQYQQDIFNDLYIGLCTKFEEHYTVVKTGSLTKEHLIYSGAIVVTDGGLSKKKHKNIQIRLSEYARAGGTLILACLFSNFVSGPNFDSMCLNMELPWGWGDYHRTDFALNPAFAPVFGNETFRTLDKSYSMKAVHLKNVPAAAKLYLPTNDSRVQSFVFPPDRVDTAQTPAVWQKHGQGFIAYIGDVNNESGSQVLIMAMLSTAAKRAPGQGLADEFADLPALVSGCEMCGKDTPIKKCARCRSVQYCSVDCQKADWKSHKEDCQQTGS